MKAMIGLCALLVLAIPARAQTMPNQLITMAASGNAQGRVGFGCDFVGMAPFKHAKGLSLNLGIAATTAITSATLFAQSDFCLEVNLKIASADPKLPALVIGIHGDPTNQMRCGGFVGLAFGSL